MVFRIEDKSSDIELYILVSYACFSFSDQFHPQCCKTKTKTKLKREEERGERGLRQQWGGGWMGGGEETVIMR